MSSVRRPRVTHATAAVASFCLLALAGCSGGGAGDFTPRPTAASSEATDDGTWLADLDTTALVVPRAPFCDRVDPAEVTRALGEEAADASAYRSGQRVRISDDVADVVHEFGCRWTAGDNTAEAWVFAPPITRRRAGALAREVANRPDCLDPAGPDFGRPSAACTSADRSAVATTFQGLFGDAWLACSLSLAKPTDADIDEVGPRWCAAVALGAASAG